MSEELLEILAAIEHERWSRWHRYARANWSGEQIARWDELAEKSYADLSEESKESDRAEVRRYLPLVVDVKERNKYRSLAEQLAISIEHCRHCVTCGDSCKDCVQEGGDCICEKTLSLACEMGVLPPVDPKR